MSVRRLPVVVLIPAFVAACVTITPVGPAPATPLRSLGSASSSQAATAVAIASPSTPQATPTPPLTAPPTAPPTPTPEVTAAATFAITPGATAAATTGAPAISEEALVASMLTVEDVDPTATTNGVDVGTEADDLPGF